MVQARASIKVCAQSLQARFALRKMLMRGGDLSQQQMEFVVKYLQQETSIHRFGWWQLLTHTEKSFLFEAERLTPRRLALAGEARLRSIEKGTQVTILTKAANEAHVVLRGRSECYLLETQVYRPVINADGFVFGNLKITNTTYSDADPAGWVSGSAENHLCPYRKVVLVGPADYLIITANFTINGAVRKVANVTRNHGLTRFGLDALAPYARLHTHDAGTHIVRQGDPKSYLYLITRGTCKATYKEETALLAPEDRSFDILNATGVDVALLGPQSYVGDVAALFDLPEPVTVTCLSDVDVVYFNLHELYDVLKVADDIKRRMVVVAHQTLDFILERMGYLIGDTWAKASPIFQDLQSYLSQHPLPHLPPIDDDAKRPTSAPREESDDPAAPTTPTAMASDTPRTQLLREFKHTSTANLEPLEPTKEMLLALHSMHSSFRKRSLATHGLAIVSPQPIAGAEAPTAPPPQLFLFPTMTKQRQYHGRTLPLLDKCHGLETPYSHKSTSSLLGGTSDKI
ncbi:hypothetical protein ACHHYP_14632 [Achlya hypogyna]|uniref:Cyclic nucleotide-binding domain-containing protein n=1 Tax=Achlya hypogyna TaxID=1202772 RepID=A0A1V9ZF36_ACHHY|nr:hypothetical protein ACHHYP_14632 [Achlya hypogyna]